MSKTKVSQSTKDFYQIFHNRERKNVPDVFLRTMFYNRGWIITLPVTTAVAIYSAWKFSNSGTLVDLIFWPMIYIIPLALLGSYLLHHEIGRAAFTHLIELAQKPDYYRKKAAIEEGFSEEEAQKISDDLERRYKDIEPKYNPLSYGMGTIFGWLIYPGILMIYGILGFFNVEVWPMSLVEFKGSLARRILSIVLLTGALFLFTRDWFPEEEE